MSERFKVGEQVLCVRPPNSVDMNTPGEFSGE